MSRRLGQGQRSRRRTVRPSLSAWTRDGGTQAPPNVSDQFADLLAPLPDAQRRGLVGQLAVGFYEGWQPSRAEVAELVEARLGYSSTRTARRALQI